jgi:hypothetical protein
MFEKIIAQIAFALFAFLEKRMEKGSTAIDSQVDRDRLIAAGSKLDDWMRKQNDTSVGGQPVSSGTQRKVENIQPDGGAVESQR